MSLPRAYISINKIDIKYLSETYLDSSIPSDDDNLELPGYNLEHADNPTNTSSGACICYHSSLPLKVIDIQLCNLLCSYRSPSQTRDISETFADNFGLTLDTIINKNPFLFVALGDFNAKLTNWYKNDINSYGSFKN